MRPSAVPLSVGTRASLERGDAIAPDGELAWSSGTLDGAIWAGALAGGDGPPRVYEAGHVSNFGPRPRAAGFVYFTRTLDAAAWGAELAAGDASGRVYAVEPTGAVEDDPGLTNQRLRGNRTKYGLARDPIRVTGEVADWPRHPAAAVAVMKASLARLEAHGVEAGD